MSDIKCSSRTKAVLDLVAEKILKGGTCFVPSEMTNLLIEFESELAENDRAIEKIKVLRKALEEIRDRCQMTGISFEDQSYRNYETARNALLFL